MIILIIVNVIIKIVKNTIIIYNKYRPKAINDIDTIYIKLILVGLILPYLIIIINI